MLLEQILTRLLMKGSFGYLGDCLKVDLLHHPEYLEHNATLGFQAVIFQWITPLKKGRPSAHDYMVGSYKPTNNDTLSLRNPGFGCTMNILYGERTCGRGDIDDMNTVITHYLYYLDLMGLSREDARPHDVLTCAEQKAFNPVPKKKETASS
nr:chitinase-like protein 1 [Tanacetum cinerariifolium]